MARFLAALLLVAALLSGCSSEPVSLAPVTGDARGPPPVDLSRPGEIQGADGTGDGDGEDVPAPPLDCATQTVQAGGTRLARIRCNAGSGRAETTLAGCMASELEPSWLTVETEEGRLASGNATASVHGGDDAVLATLRVAAAAEDGKETMVAASPSYVLTLDLEAWEGEWVTGVLECSTR